jgi:hypothetical protein
LKSSNIFFKMKIIINLAAAILGLSSISEATTITLGGGTQGYQFMTPHEHLLAPINAGIVVGSYNGFEFTQFAPGDMTPPSFATASFMAGRWLGSASDLTSAANSFAGKQIWFRITVFYQGGFSVVAYFAASGVYFPFNGFGFGDNLVVNSRDLNVVGEGSAVGAGIMPDPDGSGPLVGKVIVGFLEDVPLAPEPSAAAMSFLGLLALFRRRRR